MVIDADKFDDEDDIQKLIPSRSPSPKRVEKDIDSDEDS